MNDKAEAVYKAMGGARYFTHRGQAEGRWHTEVPDKVEYWVMCIENGEAILIQPEGRQPAREDYSLEYCEDAVSRGNWVEIREEEVDEICSGRREKR